MESRRGPAGGAGKDKLTVVLYLAEKAFVCRAGLMELEKDPEQYLVAPPSPHLNPYLTTSARERA